jgi:uncharacterized protein (DUF427 family)
MNLSPFANNPSPGFRDHPDHNIRFVPVPGIVRVHVDGVQVAESRSALIVSEVNHPPIYYLPLEDVDASLLRRSSHVTRCPFKGKASYWNIAIGEHEIDNALWTYELPYDEMLELAGLAGFQSSKVSIIAESAQ